MSLDTPLIARARELARRAHQDQKRKASGLPYFTHLEGVAEILEAHGYSDETILAAAYLHDLIEDQPAATTEFYQTMPRAVVELVEALTEQKLDANGQKRAKAERFAGYLNGLSTASDSVRRAVPISCADRIHNMQSIVTDEQCGRSPFMQLTTRPGELIKQQVALRNVYKGSVAESLLQTYDDTGRDLTAIIERWLPGRAALIASQAHLGQFDKGGHPYILHPMRLALRANTPEERVVALLHDVVVGSPGTELEFAL